MKKKILNISDIEISNGLNRVKKILDLEVVGNKIIKTKNNF